MKGTTVRYSNVYPYLKGVHLDELTIFRVYKPFKVLFIIFFFFLFCLIFCCTFFFLLNELSVTYLFSLLYFEFSLICLFFGLFLILEIYANVLPFFDQAAWTPAAALFYQQFLWFPACLCSAASVCPFLLPTHRYIYNEALLRLSQCTFR